MPRKTVIVCDNCANEQDEKEAQDWLAVNVSSLRHDSSVLENPLFCSYRCMGEWASNKEAQLAPA